MINLFDEVPSGFFNCLSSGSNHRVYADCLFVIYEQYDREITYRISRNRIRDALAAYFLEHHIHYIDVEDEQGEGKNYNDIANGVIRKFCSKEIGWLEEENDEATYEKHIIMTEQGILLTEFLQKLIKPEREEFSSYIFHIYNLLQNVEQWKENPYVDGLKNIYRNARLLSKSLKRLATFIKKIIERMVKEESLESLTENLLDYCDGSFVREYERLTKQQNIHIYRTFIKSKLDSFLNDSEINRLLVAGCAMEEEMSQAQAGEYVMDMIQATKRFLAEDYDRIMRDIKHKITVYLQIAIGRARFLRNKEADMRGTVEQTLRYIVKEMDEIDWKEALPEEMTEEEMQEAWNAHQKEAFNPYEKEKMKEYLESLMDGQETLSCESLPLKSKRDLLCALSAIAYSDKNGYSVRLLDGYLETHQMLLRRFDITKEDLKCR